MDKYFLKRVSYLKVVVVDTGYVDLRVPVCRLGRNVHVIYAVHEQAEVGEEHVVHLDEALRIVLAPRECTGEVEPELRDGHEDVLVEDVAHRVAHADVIVAPVL